jgi:hypothetical protein
VGGSAIPVWDDTDWAREKLEVAVALEGERELRSKAAEEHKRQKQLEKQGRSNVRRMAARKEKREAKAKAKAKETDED